MANEQDMHQLVRFVGLNRLVHPLAAFCVSIIVAQSLGPEGNRADSRRFRGRPVHRLDYSRGAVRAERPGLGLLRRTGPATGPMSIERHLSRHTVHRFVRNRAAGAWRIAAGYRNGLGLPAIDCLFVRGDPLGSGVSTATTDRGCPRTELQRHSDAVYGGASAILESYFATGRGFHRHVYQGHLAGFTTRCDRTHLCGQDAGQSRILAGTRIWRGTVVLFCVVLSVEPAGGTPGETTCITLK